MAEKEHTCEDINKSINFSAHNLKGKKRLKLLRSYFDSTFVLHSQPPHSIEVRGQLHAPVV